MSDSQPWTRNRADTCCLCGKPIDFYDSKFIEKAEPHRIVCAFGPPDGCGHADLGSPMNRQLWYYWTDG